MSSTDAAETKRLVNRSMRELLLSEGIHGEIPFLCECSDPACYRVVWLTPGAYERRRDSTGALAAGHARVGSHA